MKISIIIVTHGVNPLVFRSIFRTILSHPKDTELVVVDTKDDDAVGAVLRLYSSSIRWKYIQCNKANIAFLYETGVEHSSGDIIIQQSPNLLSFHSDSYDCLDNVKEGCVIFGQVYGLQDRFEQHLDFYGNNLILPYVELSKCQPLQTQQIPAKSPYILSAMTRQTWNNNEWNIENLESSYSSREFVLQQRNNEVYTPDALEVEVKNVRQNRMPIT